MAARAGWTRRLIGLAGTVALLAGVVAPAGAAPAAGTTVTNAIVRHDVRYLDDGQTRPTLFSYTGALTAESSDGAVTADVFTEPARLDRDALVPLADEGLPLTWQFAGRGAPANVNLQDTIGVHVLTPARADTYRAHWYHRQETATHLWSWGGILAGSQVHGRVSSENTVFGVAPRPVAYPQQEARGGDGQLMWDERTIVETAATTHRDPTGEDYTGLFAGAFAMPSLRIVGGDGVFTEDTAAPPLVVELPVRPHGGVFFSTPPSPPGVDITWSRSLDFDEQTLTLNATVAAGSVWPESGVEPDDPTLPTWTWTPWAFFYGWDYGDLSDGGAGLLDAVRQAVAPSTVRADGSLQAPPGLGATGLPELPAGLLEASLPPGTFFEAWTGERVHVGGLRLPTAPGVRPLPAGDAGAAGAADAALAAAPAATLIERDGVSGFAFGMDGDRVGELFVPHVVVDGEPHLLDAATVVDRFAQAPGDPTGHGTWYMTSLHRVDGLFLSVLLSVSHAEHGSHAAYHLWDAHSVDSQERAVALHVLLDPELNGGDANHFVEPFHTGSTYEEEAFVPQGLRNPADPVRHGWWGSVPAIEARDHDGPGSIAHLQHVPAAEQSGQQRASLASGAYLLADDGSLHPDPAAGIDPPEDIDGADVAMVIVNRYEGTIWSRNGLEWFSWFPYTR